MDKQPPPNSTLDTLINGPLQSTDNTTQDTDDAVPTEHRWDDLTPANASNEQIDAAHTIYLQLQALKVEAGRQDGLLRDRMPVLEKRAADLIQDMDHCSTQSRIHRGMLQVADEELEKLAPHMAQYHRTASIWTAFYEDHMKGLQEAESVAANAAILAHENSGHQRLSDEVLQAVRQARADYVVTSREQVTALKESIAEINQAYFAQQDAGEYSDRLYATTAITSATLHREAMQKLLQGDHNLLLILDRHLILATAKIDEIAGQRQRLAKFIQATDALAEPAGDSVDDLIHFAEMASSCANVPLVPELSACIRELKASIEALSNNLVPPESDVESVWYLISDYSSTRGASMDEDQADIVDVGPGAAADIEAEGIDPEELNHQMQHLQPTGSLWDSAANGLP